jgi:hypothetical protein
VWRLTINPYQGLASERFWKSGVVQCDPDVGTIHAPKWALLSTDSIVTMGSCFARYLGQTLRTLGYQTPYFEGSGESPGAFSANYGNIYTARQALQLFEESRGNFQRSRCAWKTSQGTWIDCFRPQAFEKAFASEGEVLSERKKHLRAVATAVENLDVFVFTMGLTEAWELLDCGSVLPIAPGVVGGQYDKADYGSVVFSYDEVLSDLEQLLELLADMRCGRPFKTLLTVSPVPLTATLREEHVITASTDSKATLRSVAGFLTRKYPAVDYFPAYEIINDPRTLQENFASNLREISSIGVNRVMQSFRQAYADNQANAKLVAQSNDVPAQFDELNNRDCEEALLEAFSSLPPEGSQSVKKDILFFGNSHLGALRKVMPGKFARRSLFAVQNLLLNDPFNDPEPFTNFVFTNKNFEDFTRTSNETLIIVGCGIGGDGIVRALGQLKQGYEGCAAMDVFADPDLIDLPPKILKQKFDSSITQRLGIFRTIFQQRIFKKVIWIWSPDIPEPVANFIFGADLVRAGRFSVMREIYNERFEEISKPLADYVQFVTHDDALLTANGLSHERYAGSKSWDIHPIPQYWIDGKVIGTIEALHSSHFEESRLSGVTSNHSAVGDELLP